MSKNWLKLGSIKLDVVKSSLPTGTRGKTFTGKKQKQSKEIMGLAIAQGVALFGKNLLSCP